MSVIQIPILFWKNLVLGRSKCILLILEIFLALFMLLVFVLASRVSESPSTTYYEFCPARFQGSICSKGSDNIVLNNQKKRYLVYTPRSPIIDATMEAIGNSLDKSAIGFQNSKGLENHFLTKDRDSTLAGVQFEEKLVNKTELPAEVYVKLRFPSEMQSIKEMVIWNTNEKLSDIDEEWAMKYLHADEGSPPYYAMEGFLGLQQLVTYFLILTQQNKTSNHSVTDYNAMPQITMERFPQNKLKYSSLNNNNDLRTFIILMIWSIFLNCISFLLLYMGEKQSRLQEILKINNLRVWTSLISWILYGILRSSICGIAIYLSLIIHFTQHGAVCKNSDKFLLWLIILLVQLLLLVECLVVSACVSTGLKATVLAFFLIVIQTIPYGYLHSTRKIGYIIAVSLMPISGTSYLLQHCIQLEKKELGARWEYMWTTVNISGYSLGIGIVIVMIQIVSLLLLYFYLEAMMPREFGTPKPWYFPCMKSTWTGERVSSDINVPTTSGQAASPNNVSQMIEDEPRNLKVGVEIKQLRKVFNSNVVVKDVSFKMFEKQVTVLLGPNGAGKSTLISMVVGLLKPTSGTAVVNGYDIKKQLSKARKSIGICPQYNALYDKMSIEEHIKFFCRLKKSKNVNREAEHYLQATKLTVSRKAYTNNLSGGMKRRLCVALAFCGGAKIVFLDEPTAGVDASLRRDIWDLIINEKEGRTILLTTHFMDEADLLGDRIVIIAEGVIRCAGSSFFLKKYYGTGYQLVIEKAPNCNPAAVTSFLASYIKGIKIQTNVGTKLTYGLPDQSADSFPDMLSGLENNLQDLRIRDFGIQLATLEEVFLRAGTGANLEVRKAPQKPTGDSGRKDLLTGSALIKQQILAMLLKRWLSVSIFLNIIIIILPPLFLLIPSLISRKVYEIEYLPEWKFSLSHYKDATVLLQSDSTDEEFENTFQDVIVNDKGNIERVSDVRTFVREKSKHSPLHDYKYLFGVTFKKEGDLSRFKMWFNNYYFHTPGLGMQLLMDAIYKQNMGADHKIQFSNYPIKFKLETKEELRVRNGSGVGRIILIAFTLALLCMFYVTDIGNKSKHLQLTLGTNVLIYWLTPHVVDVIICLLTVILSVTVIACLQMYGFRTKEDIAILFLILMLFCLSYLTRIYLISMVIKQPATAVVVLCVMVYIEGILLLTIFAVAPKKKYVEIIRDVVIVLSNVYSLMLALERILRYHSTTTTCNNMVDMCVENGSPEDLCRDALCEMIKECCSSNLFAFTTSGIGYCLVGWAGMTIFGWLIIILAERGFLQIIGELFVMMFSRSTGGSVASDGDVEEEKFRIRNTRLEQLVSNNAVVLDGLTKRYRNVVAVQDVSLAIRGNECFGLLGTNGAGKTTTFQILTGDIRIFDGQVWTHGYNIRERMGDIRKHISYCPQFDALPEHMTVRKTLKMYCLIRGVRLEECNEVSEKLAKDFDFEDHMDKKVKQLSGGNRRKVSSAVAMIGDPDTLYMDEPTTGMDVGTRRHLWNQIIKAYSSGKCVVLTTHSMEESEALCTRVAIMVNGQIKSLGSIQHLKNKHVKGCTITVKVKKDAAVEPVESFMKNNFPKSKFVDRHQDLLTFSLEEQKQWSQMFKILQSGKKDKLFEDYTIAQPSLEDVFLTLTRYQRT